MRRLTPYEYRDSRGPVTRHNVGTHHTPPNDDGAFNLIVDPPICIERTLIDCPSFHATVIVAGKMVEMVQIGEYAMHATIRHARDEMPDASAHAVHAAMVRAAIQTAEDELLRPLSWNPARLKRRVSAQHD